MVNKTQLSLMSIEELEEIVSEALDLIEVKKVEKKKEAFLAAKASADKYGFDLEELVREFKSPSGRVSIPKYRNPEDFSQTWTGRGRRPAWFEDALSKGLSPEDLEVPAA